MKNRLCNWPGNAAQWMSGALLGLSLVLAENLVAQPVTISIRQSNRVATAFWPAGLNLVQPQKATNLAVGAWQDFGAATAATNIVDTNAARQAFFRLRFLPPTISTQPQGQSLAAGATANLAVAATGTAPLGYQWRKDNANLIGQTNATLSLTNVTSAVLGNFSVLITNRAGSITSAVATLTLAVPTTLPRGIYMGNFTGQTNGGIAFMVLSNATAIVLANNPAQAQNAVVTNLAINSPGAFNLNLGQGASIKGSFAGDSVTGTLVNTNSASAQFTGTRKADTGIHQSNVGYYSGTFTGLLTGTINSILAADGTVFNVLSSALFNGGSYGKIDAANNFTSVVAYTLPGATAPSLINIVGSLNPTTHQFTATYGLGTLILGSFTLTRVSTP